MRLRLDLAYDGTGFHGWASQEGLRTVQGEVTSALHTVLRGGAGPLTVAGRTDAGVHARGQVAHVDVRDQAAWRGLAPVGRSTSTPEEALLRRVNGLIPPDVRLLRVRQAPAGFDARFSALWRRYAYRVADRPELVDPLSRTHVLARPRSLDVAAMNVAAGRLLGEHDFASFCKRREGATTVRELQELLWRRDSAGRLELTVRADAFCHHMVRALVGCLLAVGEGRRSAGWAAEVLGRRERDPAVTVMPAHGLTLEEVGYPPDDELEKRAALTRQVRTAPSE